MLCSLACFVSEHSIPHSTSIENLNCGPVWIHQKRQLDAIGFSISHRSNPGAHRPEQRKDGKNNVYHYLSFLLVVRTRSRLRYLEKGHEKMRLPKKVRKSSPNLPNPAACKGRSQQVANDTNYILALQRPQRWRTGRLGSVERYLAHPAHRSTRPGLLT